MTWIWKFHHVAQLPSRFCQIPISPSRIGQTVEHLKSRSINPTQVSEQMKHLVLIGDKCVLLSGIHLILILCYLSAGVVDPAEGLAHPERGRRRVHAGRAVPAAPRRRRRLQVDAHDQVLGGEGRGHVRLPGRRDESSVLCHIVQFVQLCC